MVTLPLHWAGLGKAVTGKNRPARNIPSALELVLLLQQNQANPTYIHQVIKHTGMKGLGQCIPGVAGLFHIQCDINGLRFASPLALHLSAGQFLLQAVLVNSQEKSRES